MSFDDQVRQAIKVAERLGTWVLYAVRDARDIKLLVGYMAYKIDDFERRKQRKRSIDVRAYYSKRISHWRRALRWVGSLDADRYGVTAERIIEILEKHPEHRKLPYVAEAETAEPGTSGKVAERIRAKRAAKPTRRAGRPRTRPQAEKAWQSCRECGGVGVVPG